MLWILRLNECRGFCIIIDIDIYVYIDFKIKRVRNG